MSDFILALGVGILESEEQTADLSLLISKLNCNII